MKRVLESKKNISLRSLIQLPRVKVKGISMNEDQLFISAEIASKYGFCPLCGSRSKRLHSYYCRKLQDLPIISRSVKLELKVRKIFCDNPKCSKKVFSQQLSDKVVPYSRRTSRANDRLLHLSKETSSNKASWISEQMLLRVSSSTCLRTIHKCNVSPPAKMTHLGIDDWAYHKGHTYGTIVVNRETGKTVEVLKSREKEDIAEWLRQYPDIKTITRDRGDCYIQAVSEALPDAIQKLPLTTVMGYIMKRRRNILIILLLLRINLSAQIVYDTIPDDEVIIGGHGWEELFVFKDFKTQVLTYFDKIDFENFDCYGEKVFVETVFGKNGELKNTRIVKSANSICDSIAFNFVNELKDWLPGIQRGRFVDIPFVFPITFDSLEIKDKYVKAYGFLNATAEEFDKRKKYFDFVYSKSSQKVINDFELFYKFLAEKLSGDSLYVYCWEYTKPKRKDRVKINLNRESSDCINFIIYYPENPRSINYIFAKERWIFYWDKNKWQLIPNLNPPKKSGTVYLEKNKKTMLIGYVSGKEEPKLAIYKNIIFSSDTILNLDLKKYNKNDLMNEIKYSP